MRVCLLSNFTIISERVQIRRKTSRIGKQPRIEPQKRPLERNISQIESQLKIKEAPTHVEIKNHQNAYNLPIATSNG